MSTSPPANDHEGLSDKGEGLGLDGVGFLLGAAHRARRRQWEAILADLGLSAPQAALLRIIAAEPGCGVRQLARRIGTDPMNAQRITESLAAQGLCESKRDPGDARRRPLFPTSRGLDMAAAVRELAQRDYRYLADALGDEEHHRLVEALRFIIGLSQQSRGDS